MKIKVTSFFLFLLVSLSSCGKKKKNTYQDQYRAEKIENIAKIDSLNSSKDEIKFNNTRHSDSLVSFRVKIGSMGDINIETIDFWYNAEIKVKTLIHNDNNILISRLFLGNNLIEDQFLFAKHGKKWKLNKYYIITESEYPNLEKCLTNIEQIDSNEINLINLSSSDKCQNVDDYNNKNIF